MGETVQNIYLVLSQVENLGERESSRTSATYSNSEVRHVVKGEEGELTSGQAEDLRVGHVGHPDILKSCRYRGLRSFISSTRASIGGNVVIEFRAEVDGFGCLPPLR